MADDWGGDSWSSEWQEPASDVSVSSGKRNATRPQSKSAGNHEQQQPEKSPDWNEKWSGDEWDSATPTKAPVKPSPKASRTAVKKPPAQRKSQPTGRRDNSNTSIDEVPPQSANINGHSGKTASTTTVATSQAELEEEQRKRLAAEENARRQEEEAQARREEEQLQQRLAEEAEAKRKAEEAAAAVRQREEAAARAREEEQERRRVAEAEEKARAEELRLEKEAEKERLKRQKSEDAKRKKEEERQRKEQERLERERFEAKRREEEAAAAELARIEQEENARWEEQERQARLEQQLAEEAKQTAEREAAEARLAELVRQEEEKAAAEIEIHRLQQQEELRRHQEAEQEAMRLHAQQEAVHREEERLRKEEAERTAREVEDERIRFQELQEAMRQEEERAQREAEERLLREVEEEEEVRFQELQAAMEKEVEAEMNREAQELPLYVEAVEKEAGSGNDWDSPWTDDWNDSSTLGNITTLDSINLADGGLTALTKESLENHNVFHGNGPAEGQLIGGPSHSHTRVSTGGGNQFSTEMADLNNPLTSTFIDAPPRHSLASSLDAVHAIEARLSTLSLSSVNSERSFEDEEYGNSGQVDRVASPSDYQDESESDDGDSHGLANGYTNGDVRNRSPGAINNTNRPQLRNHYDSPSTDSGDERRDGSHEPGEYSPSFSRSSYSTHSDDDDEEEQSHISAETVNSVGSNWTMTDPMEKVMRAFGMVVPAAGQYANLSIHDTLPYGYGQVLPPPPPAFFPTAVPTALYAPSLSTDAKHIYPHAAGDYVNHTAVTINNEEKPPVLDVFRLSGRRRVAAEVSKFPHDLTGNAPGTDDRISTFCKHMEESALEFGSLNPAKRDESVMWSLLSLLVRHGSNVRNFAISEILMGASRDHSVFGSSASLATVAGTSSFVSESYPGERKLSTVRRSLAAGLIPRACKAAEENGRTPLAFMLLSLPSVMKTNNKTALGGFMRYIDRTMSSADPIYTACALMCGASPRVAECGKNWMEHVAVVIGCGVLIATAAKTKFMLSLAEYFDGSGKAVARDVLYLLSRPGPRVQPAGGVEMKLIGTDVPGSLLSGKIIQHRDKLYMTEIYVYVARKISQNLSAVFVSPIQLEYLTYLFSLNLMSAEAAAYLFYISRTVISTDTPMEPAHIISLFTTVVQNRTLLGEDEYEIFRHLSQRVQTTMQEQGVRRADAERKLSEDRRAAEAARQAVLQRMEEQAREEDRIRYEMARIDQRKPSVLSYRSTPEPVSQSLSAGFMPPYMNAGEVSMFQVGDSSSSRPASSHSRRSSFPPSSPPPDSLTHAFATAAQPPRDWAPVEHHHSNTAGTSHHMSMEHQSHPPAITSDIMNPSMGGGDDENSALGHHTTVEPESGGGGGTWDDEDDLTSFYRLPKKQEEEREEASHSGAPQQVWQSFGTAPTYEQPTHETSEATSHPQSLSSIPLFAPSSDGAQPPMMFQYGWNGAPQNPPNDHSDGPAVSAFQPAYHHPTGDSHTVSAPSGMHDGSLTLGEMQQQHEDDDQRRESSASEWSAMQRPLSVDLPHLDFQQPSGSFEYGATSEQHHELQSELPPVQDYYHLEYSQNPEAYQTNYWNNTEHYGPTASDNTGHQQQHYDPTQQWSSPTDPTQYGYAGQPQTGSAGQPQTEYVGQPQTGYAGQPQTGSAGQPQAGSVGQPQTGYDQYGQQQAYQSEHNFQDGQSVQPTFQQADQSTVVPNTWHAPPPGQMYQNTPFPSQSQQQFNQLPPQQTYQNIPLTHQHQHQPPPNYAGSQYQQQPYVNGPEIPDEEEDQRNGQPQQVQPPPAAAAVVDNKSKPGLMGRFTGLFGGKKEQVAAPPVVAPIPTLPVPPTSGGPQMFPTVGGVPGPFGQFVPPPQQQQFSGANPPVSGWSNVPLSGTSQQNLTSPSMYTGPLPPPGSFGGGPPQQSGVFNPPPVSAGGGGFIGAVPPGATYQNVVYQQQPPPQQPQQPQQQYNYNNASQMPQLNAHVAPGQKVPPIY